MHSHGNKKSPCFTGNTMSANCERHGLHVKQVCVLGGGWLSESLSCSLQDLRETYRNTARDLLSGTEMEQEDLAVLREVLEGPQLDGDEVGREVFTSGRQDRSLWLLQGRQAEVTPQLGGQAQRQGWAS